MIAASVLLLIAAAGHAAIWISLIDRMHATGWPHRLVKLIDRMCLCVLMGVPLAVAWWAWRNDARALMPWQALSASTANGPSVANRAGWLVFEGYLIVCWLSAVAALAARVRWTFFSGASSVLRFHRRRNLAPQAILHCPDHPHHAVVHLPGNESLKIDLTERGLDVPRLPPALEGLSIVHLSDFHFTGKVGKPYFEEVVRMSNALEPEIVAVTGDLVDKTQQIDWIPDTLGRLKARYGVFYILGNHDLRADYERLRKVLGGCGLTYVGGRWTTVEIRGQAVLLAGNELPWFKPAADLGTAPPRSEVPFRLLLIHSPDQFAWARQGDGDLALAGHTHGGQIRLPLIGAVFSASRTGVQYASGLFYDPPTILNVSRGISAEFPFRWNCTPEIIHLTLHAGYAG